ncbi:LacI family DNA-binding transcriptional regulator [Anaerosacchariphilus polymeriproducens]|uniref:LacI family transcriptional regulator n=1 Tax=Anaerosacchariphilus polymeriproducens TaxID=1812858 RepID=A0A371AWV4_9FIRM|nr:LacI family DNA-binding transcriptional regulator [Anaerosacchariphilus polymeriproducens]RDU24058.1 LacI family transcriptional regulator [Anaerosacchariphilus polymeriproducens]
MATIKEVAKACNVSTATVSNILNGKPGASEKTIEMVKKAIKELDYTPNHVAKNLKMKNTRSIGVIAEDMTIFSIPDIIDGITEYCEEVNYQILLTNLRLFKKYEDSYYNRKDYFEVVQQEIRKLMSKQVEGIIYVAAHERVIQCIPDNLSIPAVMAYGYTKSAKIPSVVVDEVDGAYQIVQHLIENGHTRIGVIKGKSDSIHAQNRLKGYQKALFENQILYNPDLICEGDWTRHSGYDKVDFLLNKSITAIFCMNDIMAGGVYDRLDELKLEIGKDISVAGYDNRELSSYYHPPLTTVNLPLHDIGYCASDVLIKMLEGDKTLQENERIFEVKCEKLLRKSVKLMN